MSNPLPNDVRTQFQAMLENADFDTELPPGTRVGRYRVVALVGEGGMGRVYRAEQLEPVQRTVALKLIRGATNEPLLAATLLVEAQSLAQVAHPAIARIYEIAQSDTGVPFLALEWVEGEALHRYIERTQPPLLIRLQMIERIALGAHHAHQRGVIHRDIKPSNILVADIDGEPQPKLIDFGIAVAAQVPSGLKVQGAGSVGFMAPEQAARQASPDVRADVYSLGMTLLTTISPTTLHKTSSINAVQLGELFARTGYSMLETGDGRSMAADIAQLPRELRALLARALAPNPEDRYPSALEFAEDLARFRQRKPLRAVPRTRFYYAQKFAERNRVGLLAGGAVMLALVVGVSFAVYGLLAARAGEARAQRAAVQAEAAAKRANLLASFLQEVLAGATPDEARGQDTTLLKRIIDRAAVRARSELSDEPELRFEIERQMAGNYRLLAEPELAIERLTALLDSVEGTPIETSASGIDARRILAMSQWDAGHDKAAAENAGRAFEDAQKFGDVHTQLLALTDYGWIMVGVDLEQALVLLRQATEVSAQSPDFHREQIEAHLRLANAELMANKVLDAEQRFAEWLPRQAELFGADHPQVLRNRADAVIVKLKRREFDAAERTLKELLPPFEDVFGVDHSSVLTLINNLGAALRQQGKWMEAAPYYERAFESFRRLRGERHPNTLIAEGNLALLRVDQGRAAEVVERQPALIAAIAEEFPPHNRVHAEFRQTLARALSAVGRHAEALEVFESAYERTVAQQGPGASDAQEIVDDVLKMTSIDTSARARWSERKTPMPATAPDA